MSEECLLSNVNDEVISNSYKNGKLRYISKQLRGIEPLMLCVGFVSLMQTTVMNQYIYYRVGIENNLTSMNSSLAFVCNPLLNTSHDKTKTDKLQEINSHFLFLISVGSSIAAIVTTPFYSVISDRFGRKILFLVPGLGIMIKSILETFIIRFDWPLIYFIVVETFYGLSGGYNFFLALSFSYVADSSSWHWRTFRIGLVGIMIACGALVASTSSGYWISHSKGYFYPFLSTTIVSCICFFYPLLILYSPPKSHSQPVQTLSSHLSSLITVHRHQILLSLLLLLSYLCYNIGEMSGVDLQTTYLMSYPICMNTIELGYYGSINIVAINLGVGLSSLLLNKCIPDLLVVLCCLTFGIAFNLQMAFATSKLAAFIATGSNILSFSGFPFLRGFMSKRTSSDQQGALFGGLVFLETLSSSVSKVLMVYVYQHTLYQLHGAVFILIASFSVLGMVFVASAIIVDRSNKMCRNNKMDK